MRSCIIIHEPPNGWLTIVAYMLACASLPYINRANCGKRRRAPRVSQ